MNRYDDDAYTDDVQPNATCTDCSVDFSRAEEDPGTLCDACSDRREAWLSSVQLRMTHAGLTAVAAALRKEVA